MPIDAINSARFHSSLMDKPANFSNRDEALFLSPSSQLQLYGLQQDNYTGLKHIQEATKDELVYIAKRNSRRLCELTNTEGYAQLTATLLGGFLTLAGAVNPDYQKLLTGIGQAFGQMSEIGRTFLASRRIPIQTELDLIKGSEIPDMDKQARDYFDSIRELKDALRRLAENEMNIKHHIHQN